MPDVPPSRPAVELDERVRAFYEAAREGRLLLAYCEACERYELPGARACPRCLSLAMVWREARGRGVVFSLVIFHRSFHPAFEVPYAVAVIELAEGPRLVGEVVGVEAHEITPGMAVEACFISAAEDQIPLRFKVQAEPA